jgi:prepilin-type N-terminal cleavage/methylation domain-containing protein
MKRKLNKGFTLAELLIVVAIIGVLVAISIPIFTSQLEKAREATDAANIRSQYAEVMTEAITDGGDVDGKELFGAVELKQKKDQWQSSGLKENLEGVYQKVEGDYPKAGGTAWVEYKDDQVILHYEGGSGSSGSGNAGGGSTGGGSDSGGSTGGGSTSGGTGGGSGSLANPDEINTTTNLPNAFNSSINDWNKIVSENPSYNIVLGMVYSYQGSIYFGTSNTEVKNDQYTHQDLNDAVNWFAAAKYTGKIWNSSDFENQRNDITRGDICKVGKDYYVFKDGGNTSSGPEKEPGRWQKINLNE